MKTTARRRIRQRSLHPDPGPSRGPSPTRAPRVRNHRFGGSTQEASSTEPEIDSIPNPGWKRRLDLGFILLVFPLLLVLGMLVACWIRVVSRGPVIFRQTRIGQGGKPFTIYKFRSMQFQSGTREHEAHVEKLILSNQSMTKLDQIGDKRLIFGGCFLRATGLDELPQVLNVIRGEMSLVGPRPCVAREFELYDADQSKRFSVVPGITGVWQVRCDDTATFRQMVKMDGEYVEQRSLLKDLYVLARTPLAVAHQIRLCFDKRLARMGNRSVTSRGLRFPRSSVSGRTR
ncbi:sugar transferase [Haloferula sp.]|uniref:sugar transferase n=1 Tax=Haloferula sp. TaxID=2497595 RepID=UPI003C74D967